MKGVRSRFYTRLLLRSSYFNKNYLSPIKIIGAGFFWLCVVSGVPSKAFCSEKSKGLLSHKPKASEIIILSGDYYDLHEPLFSDFAFKIRSVKIPRYANLDYEDGVIIYPQDTEITKTFYYYTHDRNDCSPTSNGVRALKIDQRSQHDTSRLHVCAIETRVLKKTSAGWVPAVYIWNDQQTHAHSIAIGASVDIALKGDNGEVELFSYGVPSNSDCRQCHQGGVQTHAEFGPVGPRKMYRIKNSNGKLAALISRLKTKNEARNSTLYGIQESEARIYLDINCAHCHNRSGQAASSGLMLSYAEQDAIRVGVCKPSVLADGMGFVIEPGNVRDSILMKRFNSLDSINKMPELNKSLVDSRGVELISAWINGMSGDCI